MIPQALIAAAIAAVAAAGAWSFQEARYGKQIADIHAEHSLALAAATAGAHAETLRLQEIVNAAERKNQVRIATLRRDRDRAHAVIDGLRNDLATARVALPDATCTSVRDYTATLADVFGECTAEVGRLAETADRHSLDAARLIEAWPTVLVE